jgi:hypothetical protein
MSNVIFYEMVKKFCKEQKPPIFIKDLVFEANFAINPYIMEGVDDIEKLRKSLIASYYSPKRIGKYPPLDLAVEMAKILKTSVEYLVTGVNVNRDDIKQKMDILTKSRALEKELHKFNVNLGNELDLKDVES